LTKKCSPCLTGHVEPVGPHLLFSGSEQNQFCSQATSPTGMMVILRPYSQHNSSPCPVSCLCTWYQHLGTVWVQSFYLVSSRHCSTKQIDLSGPSIILWKRHLIYIVLPVEELIWIQNCKWNSTCWFIVTAPLFVPVYKHETSGDYIATQSTKQTCLKFPNYFTLRCLDLSSFQEVLESS
jgi:hypothetical protein